MGEPIRTHDHPWPCESVSPLEQATGIAPVTPVWRTDVSLQHFACLAVPAKGPGFLDRRRRYCCVRRPDRGLGGNRTHVTAEQESAARPAFATNPSDVVPPSGIEPEPLGLQPSAQTNYARVGYMRRALVCPIGFPTVEPARGASSSSSLFGCQRSPAVRCPYRIPFGRAHLGPRCDRDCRERTLRVFRSPV